MITLLSYMFVDFLASTPAVFSESSPDIIASSNINVFVHGNITNSVYPLFSLFGIVLRSIRTPGGTDEATTNFIHAVE